MDAMFAINWYATVIAAVSAFVLGGAWYSPAMFHQAWMAASGMTPERQQQGHPAQVFGISFAWALVGAICLAVHIGPKPDLGFAVLAGFSTGLLLVAGSFGINYQFERKPLKLWLVNGGYHTVQYTLYGLILGLWH